MRAAVAIVISVLLVLAPSALPGNAALATKSLTACSCHKSCCTAKPAPAAPTRAPLAPVQTPSLKLAGPVLLLVPFTQVAPLGAACFLPSAAPVQAGALALPLYQRNCAFLI